MLFITARNGDQHITGQVFSGWKLCGLSYLVVVVVGGGGILMRKMTRGCDFPLILFVSPGRFQGH